MAKRLVLIFIGLLAGVFFFYAHLAAQEGEVSISISPLLYQLVSNPGNILEERVRVTNTSAGPMTILGEVEDFTPRDEEGNVDLVEQAELLPYSLTAWTTLEPAKFTLQPGESQNIVFTIRVPANAEPGGHYGALAFQPETLKEGEVGVVGKVASLVLLKVAGVAKEEASVASFSAPRFSEYGPITFDLRVRNTGNVHLRPLGVISITDLFGQKVADVSIEQKNVLPGSIRHLQAVWEEKNLAGRYTANLLAYYGDKNEILTATANFTVFPAKRAGAILGGGVLFGFLGYRGRRRLGRALKVLLGKA